LSKGDSKRKVIGERGRVTLEKEKETCDQKLKRGFVGGGGGKEVSITGRITKIQLGNSDKKRGRKNCFKDKGEGVWGIGDHYGNRS